MEIDIMRPPPLTALLADPELLLSSRALKLINSAIEARASLCFPREEPLQPRVLFSQRNERTARGLKDIVRREREFRKKVARGKESLLRDLEFIAA
jgi:hypothetical protein